MPCTTFPCVAGNVDIPVLEGDAAHAVAHRGGHIQIIAAAGAGKTEVVSQRVADLLQTEPPESIVAFTFTERAATELKNRIAARVEQRLGGGTLDRMGRLFVGTIHSYCFRLLQVHAPRYETFDVMDDNQLMALLARESNRLQIKSLDPKGRMFAAIKTFLRNADVVENELIDPTELDDPFGEVFGNYLATLERYRLLSYGQQIARAVSELERPEVAAAVHADLRHLIVDEYQDVNPAQERLVELLAAGPEVELCVVGDDDQAIYQWRGSDVENILDFSSRYEAVRTFAITTNRRSLPQIIDTANAFVKSVPKRLPKQMAHFRDAPDDDQRVLVWTADSEAEEAQRIADEIAGLNAAGLPYNDIAVLVRTSAAYAALIDAFHDRGVPVQPGGRSALFETDEARALGKAICLIAGIDWKIDYGAPETLEADGVADELLAAFGLPRKRRTAVKQALAQWAERAENTDLTANLVGEIYDLYGTFDVASWDLDDPVEVNRLGTLARFTALLADYESVRRRSREDSNNAGEQVGGEGRDLWYYRNLATFIINHASSAYDGFDGEQDFNVTGVDLLTIHRAKGLEWPVVFVPSLTKGRFPSRYMGKAQDWLVPRHLFDAERYEGCDADERRLFYVALTRARDLASISRHVRVKKNAVASSPYFEDVSDLEVLPDDLVLPVVPARSAATDEDPIALSFSELAQFMDCAMEYRLRNRLGFQPRLAQELGYGKAVHHVLRAVAERTKAAGAPPSADELQAILDASFFLPTANKAAHRQMKEAARRLVSAYVGDHAEDLQRTWETERAFELHLDGVIVTGRADVILDREDGRPDSLAILDYKTSTSDDNWQNELQLRVYADAGRREGLEVSGAYVHDLGAANRVRIDVSDGAVAGAERVVVEAAERLREADFTPSPERAKCRRCEVRTVCGAAAR